MNKITDNIFISDWTESNSEWFITKNQITAAINLSHHPIEESAGIKRYWIPMDDNRNIDQDKLMAAALQLKELLDQGEIVLVHCLAGVSRSPTVVALYLAMTKGWTLNRAYDYIGSKRPVIFPNESLKKAAKRLLGE